MVTGKRSHLIALLCILVFLIFILFALHTLNRREEQYTNFRSLCGKGGGPGPGNLFGLGTYFVPKPKENGNQENPSPACNPKGAHGASCTNNSECLSGLCRNKMCVGKALEAKCRNDGECLSGNCDNGRCVPGTLGQGDACSANAQCSTNLCADNACAEAPLGSNIQLGEDCKQDIECATQYCNSMGRCDVRNGGINAECDANTFCQSGFCGPNQRCQRKPLGENGAACFAPSDCKSGYCDNGICTTGPGPGPNPRTPEVQACTTPSDCNNGNTCVNNVCSSTPSEECTTPSDCDDEDTCVNNVCTPRPAPRPAPGPSCDFNGDYDDSYDVVTSCVRDIPYTLMTKDLHDEIVFTHNKVFNGFIGFQTLDKDKTLDEFNKDVLPDSAAITDLRSLAKRVACVLCSQAQEQHFCTPSQLKKLLPKSHDMLAKYGRPFAVWIRIHSLYDGECDLTTAEVVLPKDKIVINDKIPAFSRATIRRALNDLLQYNENKPVDGFRAADDPLYDTTYAAIRNEISHKSYIGADMMVCKNESNNSYYLNLVIMYANSYDPNASEVNPAPARMEKDDEWEEDKRTIAPSPYYSYGMEFDDDDEDWWDDE